MESASACRGNLGPGSVTPRLQACKKRHDKDSIDVATNSRSMIFVTFVSCARWYVCVFDPIYSGASLRLSVYV